MRCWNGDAEPLALAWAHLLAAAAVRRQVDEAAANPIFDAMLSKLVSTPMQFMRRRAKPGSK